MSYYVRVKQVRYFSSATTTEGRAIATLVCTVAPAPRAGDGSYVTAATRLTSAPHAAKVSYDTSIMRYFNAFAVVI